MECTCHSYRLNNGVGLTVTVCFLEARLTGWCRVMNLAYDR